MGDFYATSLSIHCNQMLRRFVNNWCTFLVSSLKRHYAPLEQIPLFKVVKRYCIIIICNKTLSIVSLSSLSLRVFGYRETFQSLCQRVSDAKIVLRNYFNFNRINKSINQSIDQSFIAIIESAIK